MTWSYKELQAVLSSPSALPTIATELEPIADAAGIFWILDVPPMHPALFGFDALPPPIAQAVLRPRFTRLRLRHYLTGDVDGNELASFGGPARVQATQRILIDVAQQVFCAQALLALERRRLDVVPSAVGIRDNMVRDLVTVLIHHYRQCAKTIAPIDPAWLGRTRTKEQTPNASMQWEAYPPSMEQGQSVRIQLELDRWREGKLTTSLGDLDVPPWFMLTLLHDVITHLTTLDQDGGARLNGIKRALGVAPWERFVAAFDAVFDPRDHVDTATADDVAKEERIVWCVGERSGSLDLSAKIQRRKTNVGGVLPHDATYSKGKRTSLKTVQAGDGGADDDDITIATILVAGRERNYLPADVLLDALEHLVDNPRVIDDDGLAATVDKANIEIAVVECGPDGASAPASGQQPTDLVLTVNLGGRREDPRELYLEAMEAGGIVRLWHRTPENDAATDSGSTGDASEDDDDDRQTQVLFARPSARATALLHALSHLDARFPVGHAEALLSRIPRLANDFSLSLPPSLRGRFVPPDSRIVARLHPIRPEGLAATFGVRPLPQSGLLDPGHGSAEVMATDDGERIRTERNLEQEAQHFANVLSTLPLDAFVNRVPNTYACENIEAALDLLGALKQHPDVCIEWPDGVSLDVTRPAVSQDLRVQVSRQRDWFGVEGQLELDGQEIGLALLFDALRDQRRYIPLEGGRFVALSQALLAKAAPLAALAFENKGALELGAGAAAAMLDLEEDGAHLDADANWNDLLERLRHIDAAPQDVPPALCATLRPYQEEGVRWLLRLAHAGVGGVLADDMGLGKTVQALAVLLARADRGPALVVAPTSVGFNWEREAERFAPSLRVKSYRGKDREDILATLGAGDVVLTSYGLLQRDAERLSQPRFATVVFDEAQALKNASTKAARAARDLDKEWGFALSGTPVENHLGELWSIFRVVSPGLLGSWARFRERYARPIEVDKNRHRQRTLARALSPFLLRRTKSEVAPELPDRTEVLVPVALTGDHRTLYEQARLSAVREFEGAKSERTPDMGDGAYRLRLLAAITRLRLCACHPQLLDPQSDLTSSKIESLVALLVRAKESGQRALVFSQFVRLLAFAKNALEAAGLSVLVLQGSTPAAKRGALVDAFQAGQADVFLISLKAGGTGLNLTAADVVVHLDPWWNPAAEAQATDRAHRIGRKKPLTIYRLVATKTIEDEILALHADKRALAEGVWNTEDEDGDRPAAREKASGLSLDDLAALLRDPSKAPHRAG